MMREMIAGQRGHERLTAWLDRRQQKRTREFGQAWETHFGDRGAREAWIESLKRLAPEPAPAKKAASSTGTVSGRRQPAANAAVA
jgi:hypothetical protein